MCKKIKNIVKDQHDLSMDIVDWFENEEGCSLCVCVEEDKAIASISMNWGSDEVADENIEIFATMFASNIHTAIHSYLTNDDFDEVSSFVALKDNVSAEIPTDLMLRLHEMDNAITEDLIKLVPWFITYVLTWKYSEYVLDLQIKEILDSMPANHIICNCVSGYHVGCDTEEELDTYAKYFGHIENAMLINRKPLWYATVRRLCQQCDLKAVVHTKAVDAMDIPTATEKPSSVYKQYNVLCIQH